MIVKDSDAREELMPTALALLSDDEKRHMLEKNIAALARMDAAAAIVNEIYKLV